LVQSDHKPLEAIFKKPLHAAPARLQRMMLQLQKYRLTLVHLPGKDIPVADALSRNFLATSDDNDDDITSEIELQVHQVLVGLPVSDAKMKLMREKTQKEMQDLLRVIQQ
jgi:hypothetical protein